MAHARRKLGDDGEKMAEDFLTKKGYVILLRQERTPHGEIDLVCESEGEIVFVEVKTRTSDIFGFPESSITKSKLLHLSNSSDFILNDKNWTNKPWRIDVVSIRIIDKKIEILHFPAIDI